MHESERLLTMGDRPKELESIKPTLKIDIPSSKYLGHVFMVPVPVPDWFVGPADGPIIPESADEEAEMDANCITGFSYSDAQGPTPEPPMEGVKTRAPAPKFFTFESDESKAPGHHPPFRHQGSGGKLDCAPHVAGRAGAALALGGAAALVVGGLQQAGVLEGGDDGGQSAALFGGGGVALTAGLRCVYHFYKRRQSTG